jgi:hypothetical protein
VAQQSLPQDFVAASDSFPPDSPALLNGEKSMNGNFDKSSIARRNVRTIGALILGCATLLSVASSFKLTVTAWEDTGQALAKVLGFINVIAIEGVFLWLIFGFKKAFSSALEKTLAIIGILFYGLVMGVNILIHYRIVKHYSLNDFEQAWMSWGVAVVILATIALATMLSMADPESRAIRQKLKVEGKKQDMIWTAREMMLDSEYVGNAVESRAHLDAEEFVAGLLGLGDNGNNSANLRSNLRAATFRKPPAIQKGK